MSLKFEDLGLLIVLKNKWKYVDTVCIETTIPLTKTSININYVNSAWSCHEDVDGISFLFFLNNQPDAIIIPVSFCYKTLHVSGIFSAHHQDFSTAHSALVSFMQVSDDRFKAESGRNCSSILTLLLKFTAIRC
jgi:hypothetical protein